MDKYEKLKIKYPDKIPIIIETTDKSIILNKKKFLVNKDIKFINFIGMLRNYISINSGQSIFANVYGNLIPSSDTINDVYLKYQEKNDILIINISLENTFG